ncbi:MAG TPA: winged helix-turn-helix domain-containing protein [Puia sp.]|nr:winged helix-turn-helix domain-containing protein [Puia sp.]
MTGSDGFDIARREVLLRKLGDELLTQSGDSKSRVLPVKKIADNEYQISFENELTFQPDSLVNATRRLLAKDPLTSDYVVTVLNSGKPGVAYGYAISKNKKDDIVACIGRVQPRARYIINIKFKPASLNTVKNLVLLAGLPFLAFIVFVFFRAANRRRILPGGENTGLVTLGSMLFDEKSRKLIINGETIDLTATETRVLHIFASSPNETIERSRLQKEVWEDEGVIVGRSLDMFISKLRKKLVLDPFVHIVVVRGKGYKLEISS